LAINDRGARYHGKLKGLVFDCVCDNRAACLTQPCDKLGTTSSDRRADRLHAGREESSSRNTSRTEERWIDYTMVVIVNGGSASASEISLGQARCQDPSSDRILGTRTFGKGSVQTIAARRSSALRLDDGALLTSAGRSAFQGRGGSTRDVDVAAANGDRSAIDTQGGGEFDEKPESNERWDLQHSFQKGKKDGQHRRCENASPAPESRKGDKERGRTARRIGKGIEAKGRAARSRDRHPKHWNTFSCSWQRAGICSHRGRPPRPRSRRGLASGDTRSRHAPGIMKMSARF